MAAATVTAPPVALPEQQPIITLEREWLMIEEAIARVTKHIEGRTERGIRAQEECMEIYSIVFDLVKGSCSIVFDLVKSHHVSGTLPIYEKLYAYYRQSIEEYIESEVLPPLSKPHDDLSFLRELLQRWSNYKKMVEYLSYSFRYLDWRHIPRCGLAPLKEIGLTCFRVLVYQKIKEKVKNAMINLIKKDDDDSEQNGRDFIESVLYIFAENGLHQMVCHDYEDFFLKVVTKYYLKAQNWILNDHSHSNHMIETEEYLKREEKQVHPYLKIDFSQSKLLKEVLNILFAQLLVEKPSKYFSLLQDNRVKELCKMHILFRSIGRLPKLSKMFKMHLTNQMENLVSQAKLFANKEVLLWAIVELHVKHATHVTKCFQDDTLFVKALRDSASRIWSTDFPDTICENSILKIVASGKLCNRTKKVYQEIKGKVNDALNYLVTEQLKRIKILGDKNILEGENIPEGEKISMGLLSNFVNMFSEIEPDCYEADYVVPLLQSIKKFYEKAPFLDDGDIPPPNIYIEKVIEILSTLEVERASQYSPFVIMLHKVEVEVTYVLLTRYLEALLRGNKVDHLSELYILASEICTLPESIADMLKTHLTNEITVLVKQAENFHSGKKDILRKIFDLHDKYDELTKERFRNHAAFRKVFKEAFEDLCTNNVLLLGTAVENILNDLTKNTRNQDGSSRMSNDEECPYADDMDKITRLITYIKDKDLFVKLYKDILESRIKGCFAFLLNARVKFLHRLYTLASKSSGDLMKPFVDMFKNNLKIEIEGMIKKEEDCAINKGKDIVGMWQQGLVRKIIELHDKYEEGAMKDHPEFRKALNEAFGGLCTREVSGVKGAELLATFFDNILKKECNEKLSDGGIRDDDNKVVKILTCLNEKDLFAEFYRKKLGMRLLCNKSDPAHERSFLDKLKQQFGVQNTSEMEGMINDITFSIDHQTKFKKWVDTHPELNHGMDFSVTVLKSGPWPIRRKTYDMNLPAEMVKCVKAFNEYYQTVHIPQKKKKKLTWIYSMGTCHVNAKFEAGDIELVLTPWQATLLQLFNETDRLSYSDMVTQLNLPSMVVGRLLRSLSREGYKILNKAQDSSDYEFNSKFNARNKSIIKIPPPRRDVKKKVVQEDRTYAIDAALVRIMKRQKTMPHELLVQECVKQLSTAFKPDVEAIKKRIRDLIEREYLKCDEKNPNIYKYLVD